MRIYKKLHFDAAHRLIDHEHCGNVHGHSWLVEIWIEAKVDKKNKWGMIIDFGKLKKLVERVDHRCLLANNDDLKNKIDDCVVFLGAPTCEMLVQDFLKEIKALMGDRWSKITVRIWETKTGYVEDSI